MRLSELGEFGLIDRIARFLPAPPSDVVVGIGDDVAVLRTSGPDVLLATCDAQVEGVHFIRDRITPYQLGRKLIAINVSDIASMGGEPLWALVSLALPQDLEVEVVDELYRGMEEQIRLAGAAIVGGNLSKIHGGMVIDLCLMGKAAPERVVLRKGAKPGDAIFVTGSLGDSRAGLELIRRPELAVSEETAGYLKARHLMPQPRLREGQALAASGRVHAMADVSDGLLGDMQHICRASGVGAVIRAADLPIASACAEAARAAGQEATRWALTGGEDYELLFAAAPESAAALQTLLQTQAGTSCTVVGRVVEAGEGLSVEMPNGETHPAGLRAWDHFAEA